MGYDELQSIAVTAVDTLSQVRDRCMSAEAKNVALEKKLDEAQLAIESRDLILNKYEPKEIDKTFMNTLEEIQAYMSDDTRFEEIRKKKMEDMIKKQEEILNAKYNFAPRY
jgi:pyruvate/2-oxoacid:ferredoxin oxidoreductase beta subunit